MGWDPWGYRLGPVGWDPWAGTYGLGPVGWEWNNFDRWSKKVDLVYSYDNCVKWIVVFITNLTCLVRRLPKRILFEVLYHSWLGSLKQQQPFPTLVELSLINRVISNWDKLQADLEITWKNVLEYNVEQLGLTSWGFLELKQRVTLIVFLVVDPKEESMEILTHFFYNFI